MPFYLKTPIYDQHMDKIFQWQMTELNKDFSLVESPVPELGPDEALVKVAGCGVCHTDISFWHQGVQTKSRCRSPWDMK